MDSTKIHAGPCDGKNATAFFLNAEQVSLRGMAARALVACETYKSRDELTSAAAQKRDPHDIEMRWAALSALQQDLLMTSPPCRTPSAMLSVRHLSYPSASSRNTRQ